MALGASRFPDLTPPVGWTSFTLPPQVRLIPPGTTAESARATIIVSPIAPRLPVMPPPSALLAEAIAAEARLRLDVRSQEGPEVAPSDHGLEGVAIRLEAHDRETRSDQRRVYVVYHDDRFMYGASFLAYGADFDAHLPTFWGVARSIRPFHGQVVPPAPLLPPVD
jgi:hypothetical protein